MSAEQKNLKTRTPLTDEELREMDNKIGKGHLVTMKRPPYLCTDCGKEDVRTLRYIGDKDEISEWIFICENCTARVYG